MQTQASLREREADLVYSTIKTYTGCPICPSESGEIFPFRKTLRTRLTDQRLLSCSLWRIRSS